MHALRSPLALAAVLAVALPACGTTTLDSAKVERVIKEGIEKQTGPNTVEVECPKDIEAKAGGKFTCTARAQGSEAPVEVIQRDDKGNIRWSIKPQQS